MKVILLSGGLDSTALAWWCKPDLALTIDYGQVVACSERHAADAIARDLGLPHQILSVDCAKLGRGDLGQKDPSSHGSTSEWWPYRNQLLITMAASFLVDHSPLEILIGTVKGDGKLHRDGSKRFLQRANALLRCQEGQVAVSAPGINLTTQELLITSGVPREILGWTVSCNRSELQCGQCGGCRKRAHALSAFASSSHSPQAARKSARQNSASPNQWTAPVIYENEHAPQARGIGIMPFLFSAPDTDHETDAQAS
jgi:7-cyano-7-deazaguanine synthase